MNVFNIIGPVMIGPSSSHTAGAVRLGRVANKLTDNKPLKRVEITLSGSCAQTYKGHGTDRALLAGISREPIPTQPVSILSWRTVKKAPCRAPASAAETSWSPR